MKKKKHDYDAWGFMSDTRPNFRQGVKEGKKFAKTADAMGFGNALGCLFWSVCIMFVTILALLVWLVMAKT